MKKKKLEARWRALSEDKRAGLAAVGLSLAILAATAVAQAAVYVWASRSVALLTDVIHNFGDAATTIPVALALLARRPRLWPRYVVLGFILGSAAGAAYAVIDGLIHPREPDSLLALAIAGVVGAVGNLAAAVVRFRASATWSIPILADDAKHALADAATSLAVVASALCTWMNWGWADPVIGGVITGFILGLACSSLKGIRAEAREGRSLRDPG